MKKRLSAVLVLILIGCTVFAANTSSTKKYVIANSPKCVGIAWWDRMQVGNQRFMDATGNKVYQVGPAGQADTAVQVQTIEDIIASGANAITVIPADPKTVEALLAKARSQKIVVISHEAEGMKNVDYDIEAFVNADYGAHVMDNLAQQMGGKGGYAIMMGALTMTSHQQWTAGAIARQKEKYPNMYLVCDPLEPQMTGSLEGSYLTGKEVIAKYPDVKGIIGWDMVNPPGIARAVEEANKVGKIVVTGTCLVSVAGDYIKSGTIKTISFWDPAAAGEAMCYLAVKVLNGEKIATGVNLGVKGFEKCTLKGNTLYGSAWVDVTKDNMAEYNF